MPRSSSCFSKVLSPCFAFGASHVACRSHPVGSNHCWRSGPGGCCLGSRLKLNLKRGFTIAIEVPNVLPIRPQNSGIRPQFVRSLCAGALSHMRRRASRQPHRTQHQQCRKLAAGRSDPQRGCAVLHDRGFWPRVPGGVSSPSRLGPTCRHGRTPRHLGAGVGRSVSSGGWE